MAGGGRRQAASSSQGPDSDRIAPRGVDRRLDGRHPRGTPRYTLPMDSAFPRRRSTLRARLVIRDGAAEGPAVLLARHERPGGAFWCFPGGGVEPGESAADAAVREAREETGLEVALEGVCYLQDRPEADAVDVFFAARPIGGTLRLGSDPERADGPAVLAALRFVPLIELAGLRVLPEGLAAALADGRCGAWGRLPLPLPD